jgi:hypothetical protein
LDSEWLGGEKDPGATPEAAQLGIREVLHLHRPVIDTFAHQLHVVRVDKGDNMDIRKPASVNVYAFKFRPCLRFRVYGCTLAVNMAICSFSACFWLASHMFTITRVMTWIWKRKLFERFNSSSGT